MSDTSNHDSSSSQAERMPWGKVVAEFSDVRAGAFVMVGYLVGGLGIALVAMSLLLSWGESALVFGGAATIVGAVCVAVGKFRSKNRLLIHQEGVAQTRRWRGTVRISWEDVLALHIERETRFSSGLAHDVRYHCSLQRKDGTWFALDAIRVTSSAVKSLHASAPVPVLFSETDTVVDGRV